MEIRLRLSGTCCCVSASVTIRIIPILGILVARVGNTTDAGTGQSVLTWAIVAGIVCILQVSGDPGDYQIWVDLVPVAEDGEATGEETTWGPWILLIREGAYVESRTCPLQNLPFCDARAWRDSAMSADTELLAREELWCGRHGCG